MTVVRWRPYLPSIVLLLWSFWAQLADGTLMALWLLALAVALFVMVRALLQRYSNDRDT